MIYITGDTHGDFSRIKDFCEELNTTTDDIMIILGDAGINFSNYYNDLNKKRFISKLPITLFCIHGNHDRRPYTVMKGRKCVYQEKMFHNGITYWEEEYPNIYFAKDGQVYNFNTLRTLVIGGAYSVDKQYRLKYGQPWFIDEQPDENIKNDVRKAIQKYNKDFDIVLSHTTPYKYVPREMFLSYVDQSEVDSSTELFLDEIEDSIKYKKWYCGHYHCSKVIDKIHIMFKDYRILEL